MIRKIDERIVWNHLKLGEEPPSIRNVPAIQHLTYLEFNQLVKSYHSGVSLFQEQSDSPYSSGETSNPQHPKEETLHEYFEHNKKIKGSYPTISFRVPVQLKKRWINFIDSQSVGRYSANKQAPYLIKMITDFLDKNNVPEVEE